MCIVPYVRISWMINILWKSKRKNTIYLSYFCNSKGRVHLSIHPYEHNISQGTQQNYNVYFCVSNIYLCEKLVFEMSCVYLLSTDIDTPIDIET